jgi:hypothetical protein
MRAKHRHASEYVLGAFAPGLATEKRFLCTLGSLEIRLARCARTNVQAALGASASAVAFHCAPVRSQETEVAKAQTFCGRCRNAWLRALMLYGFVWLHDLRCGSGLHEGDE